MSISARTVVVILAAGASSRFGSPKALAPWQGGNLLTHALGVARGLAQATPLVVLGGHAELLRPFVGEACVLNPDWEQGLGTSVRCGAQMARNRYSDLETVLLLPVDQPLVSSAHLGALRDKATLTGKCSFTREGPVWGPPCAVPRSCFPLFERLAPSQGLKSLVTAEQASFVDARMLADIDTPADLERLRG